MSRISATSSKCSSAGFWPNHFSNHAPPIITVSTVLSSMSKQQLSKITPSMGKFSIGGTKNPNPSCFSKPGFRYCRLITHTSTNGMLLSADASCGSWNAANELLQRLLLTIDSQHNAIAIEGQLFELCSRYDGYTFLA
uniref:Uncharacterized protein n=1 Tax=Anopheles maculatus TaxID=74869 RepID=A0A182ST65_9DIPT